MHFVMLVRRWGWVLAALSVGAAIAPSARAYEDSWTLAAAAGWVRTPEAWLPRAVGADGVGLAVEAGRGLDDAWSVRLEVGYAPHLRGGGTLAHEAWAGLDMLYALDLLDVVPYVALGAGALRPPGGSTPFPTVRLALGAEWLMDWTHQLGLELSQRLARVEAGRWEARTVLAVRFGFRFED